MTFNVFMGYVGFALTIIILIDIIFFWIIIARHYDKIFPEYAKNKEIFENQYWFFSPILRGGNYAGCMLFKNYSKKSLRKVEQNYFFKNHSFRESAHLSDWAVLIIFLICFFSMGFLGVLLFIANGFHWPSS